jgi:DHA2 family multidrug resistance protein-like MFS transporter
MGPEYATGEYLSNCLTNVRTERILKQMLNQMLPTPAHLAGPRAWIGLAVLALPTLLVSIDVSLMLLALPHIGADLGADSAQQLWIMDIYGFMLAGFMVTMGTLGDRIGRRKLLMLGAAGFGLASILAAFSTSATMLIAARGLLGIAGATLSPSILALISNMFRDPRQRAFAISVWLVCFMSGMALGPVVGGAMLEVLWWGSIFLLGVPIMLVLLVAAPLLLPEYRDPHAGRLDLVSVALSLGTILPIIYGLKQLATHGVALVPLVAILAGAGFGAAFADRQRRLVDPLLDLRLFANRRFSAALGSMFGMTLIGANMLFIAQYFQLVAGLSPLKAGLWMLPAVAGSMVGLLLSPIIARRIRPAYLIGAGLLVAMAGFLTLAQASATSGMAAVEIGFVLFNLGCAPLVTLGTDLIVGSAPREKAGAAAAMGETSSEFGFALGIATLGSLGAAIYRSQIASAIPASVPAEAAAAARDSLAGATAAAANLGDPLGTALLFAAREAFTSGMHAAALVSAVVLLGVAVLAVTMLRHVRPIGAPELEPAAEPNHAGGVPIAATAAAR